MSPLAAYHEERFGWKTLERDGAFLVYDLKPPEASIEELWVREPHRGTGLAQEITQEFENLAISANCERIWAQITPGTGSAERALGASLKYGFRLACVRDGSIIIRKDIGGEVWVR